MKCTNCGRKLGCSCNRRTATNGKQCCSQCISQYEKSIKPIVKAKPKPNIFPR